MVPDPVPAIVRNQTTMTGPNTRPIPLVPALSGP